MASPPLNRLTAKVGFILGNMEVSVLVLGDPVHEHSSIRCRPISLEGLVTERRGEIGLGPQRGRRQGYKRLGSVPFGFLRPQLPSFSPLLPSLISAPYLPSLSWRSRPHVHYNHGISAIGTCTTVSPHLSTSRSPSAPHPFLVLVYPLPSGPC